VGEAIETREESMQNFYWIGGCPSGGKTTLANKISKTNHVTVYHTDEHSLEYGLRINAKVPDFHREINVNFVESIVTMPNEPWFDIFIAGLRELCSIVLDDTKKRFVENAAVIEGGVLLPEFISEIGAERRAIFINPTYEYLCEYLPKQKWVVHLLAGIKDDECRSLFTQRLLFKYNLFREYIIESAEKFNIKAVATVTQSSMDHNLKIASQYFFLRE